MYYNKNRFKLGLCEECCSFTKVIKFKNKKTCRRCLTRYDDNLQVEDFVYSGTSCMDPGPGSYLKSKETALIRKQVEKHAPKRKQGDFYFDFAHYS